MVHETTEAEIIGYKINKEPIFADDYRKEISQRIANIKSGAAKTFTSKDVRDFILKR